MKPTVICVLAAGGAVAAGLVGAVPGSDGPARTRLPASAASASAVATAPAEQGSAIPLAVHPSAVGSGTASATGAATLAPGRAPGPSAPGPEAPVCQAQQLSPQTMAIQVATGTVIATYAVRDTSSSGCSLAAAAHPWADALAGGRPVDSVTVSGTPAGGTLAPGQTAVVQLHVTDRPGAPPAAAAGSPAAGVASTGASGLTLLSGWALPGLGLPSLSLPAWPVVSGAMARSTVPTTLPKLPLPPVTTPKVPGPGVTVPKVPGVTVPKVTVPATTVPRVPIPAVPGSAQVATWVQQNWNATLSKLESIAPAAPPTTVRKVPPATTAPPPPPPPAPPSAYGSGATGYDISWPQCGGAMPSAPYTVAVVGVNDGRAFTANPCLAGESQWAGGQRQLYLNINSPSGFDATDASGPAGNCAAANASCLAYNYGYNNSVQSMALAGRQGATASMVWLDVETYGSCGSYWSCNQGLNSLTIQGAVDALRNLGYAAGVYSTSYQWGIITGGYTVGGGTIANWLAGSPASLSWCNSGHNFGGGVSRLLQVYPPSPYDRDEAC